MDYLIGNIIGKEVNRESQWPLTSKSYKLDGPIGSGTYGLVWRSHVFDKSCKHHEQKVAIKII